MRMIIGKYIAKRIAALGWSFNGSLLEGTK